MSNDIHRHGQYRRPQHPLQSADDQVRPTIDRAQLLRGCALLTGLAVLLAIGLTPRKTALPQVDPMGVEARADASGTLNGDCALLQHLLFSPCGHSMSRRQSLPPELAGKGRDDLAQSYAEWQITSFAPQEVEMRRTVDLYCPNHYVLMPDAGGMMGVYQNKYGEAMALVAELSLPISELPDDAQDKVRTGLAFDTQDALEKWLESVES